jgi:hypothetical protein
LSDDGSINSHLLLHAALSNDYIAHPQQRNPRKQGRWFDACLRAIIKQNLDNAAMYEEPLVAERAQNPEK